MNVIFKKLNFKDHDELFVLNPPPSFQPHTDEMRTLSKVRDTLSGTTEARFVLVFATKQAEVDAFALQIAEGTRGDAVVWIAYPKGSSKNYHCEFNRDTGWATMGDVGFEPVRQVAIDEDWSALRFRRVEHIKSMTRDFAMTVAGLEKVRRPRGPGPAPHASNRTTVPVRWGP